MKTFNQLINERKNTLEYKIEEAKFDFILNVNRAIKERKISRSQLAKKLNTSKAYVTKILQGDNVNFTIETMVKISDALGGKFETKIYLNDINLNIDKNTRYKNNTAEWQKINHEKAPIQPAGNIIIQIAINECTQWEKY